MMRLAFVLPNPLQDASITWIELPWMNVTVGQLRLPFGSAATTTASQLVTCDRPGYAYAMTQASFRDDVGAMLGTGEEGLLGGLLHYRFAVASGNGRILGGDPTRIADARDLLWIGRAIVDGAASRAGRPPRARRLRGVDARPCPRHHRPARRIGGELSGRVTVAY